MHKISKYFIVIIKLATKIKIRHESYLVQGSNVIYIKFKDLFQKITSVKNFLNIFFYYYKYEQLILLFLSVINLWVAKELPADLV